MVLKFKIKLVQINLYCFLNHSLIFITQKLTLKFKSYNIKSIRINIYQNKFHILLSIYILVLIRLDLRHEVPTI